MIIFNDFPLPPSMNNCYPTNAFGRRFKSKDLRLFEVQVQSWINKNFKLVNESRELVKTWSNQGYQLEVNCFFVFDYQRIWTKKKEVKSLDSSNFVKPLHDALGTSILLIDDKHFFSGNAEKVTTDKDDQQCTIVQIKPHGPRTSISIRQQLKDMEAGALLLSRKSN